MGRLGVFVMVGLISCSSALVSCAGRGSSSGDGGDNGGAGSSGGASSGGGGFGDNGDGGLVVTTDSGLNFCADANAPKDACKLVPSGPACGDGVINQPSEECDDGNTIPGDGCSGICKIEPYYKCPVQGQPCVSTIVCGNGVLEPGEACDDGNTVSGDGCSSKCNLVEPGYECKTPGQPCIRVYVCGDGHVDPNEGCDDGNAVSGDGCDSRCRIELGFKCSGSPSVCTPTVCGDCKVEGAESCDDCNTTPFDGCSATCQAEPNCTAGPCTTVCGDGIKFGAEQCDDGNLRDGDGCSHDCKVEAGFTCTNKAAQCNPDGSHCRMVVPAAFRDTDQSVNPDFQPPTDNQTAITGLVNATLDSEDKPVASAAASVSNGYIHSAKTFGEWYRNTPGVNALINGKITLWDNGAGGFVNRWKDATGEQWITYSNLTWCDNGTCTAAQCQSQVASTTNGVCMQPCAPWGNSAACTGTPVYYDGNPVFFPVDGGPYSMTMAIASIPQPYYNGGWQPEPGGIMHNFSFTSEVHYWFQFTAGSTASLDFVGDDDVWVFVNHKLAVDLGGWHPPVEGSVTLNNASASTYGLASGNVYEIAVFQAERKTNGSSFKLTLSGFDTQPSDCQTNCGDGVVTPPEQCDDGPGQNTGAYNHCSPDCTFGPRCGDGIKQDQDGEQCDDGVNNGSYGGCAPNCQLGPHCGDGVVQPDHEQCDDGTNDGSYGKCAPGCVLGPHCGDGIVQPGFEECDDGNNVNGDGCSSACKIEIAVSK